MTPFSIVPLTNVNLRTGPGISYEIAGKVPVGYEMTASELEKDGSGTVWYKVSDGYWVNSKYVKQPNQIKRDNNISTLTTVPVNGSAQSSITQTINNTIGDLTGGLISGVDNNLGIFNSLTGIAGASSQELILQRRIFGVPFQFLDNVDMRPDSNSPLGIQFATNIMAETPVLSLLPGIPDYLSEKSIDEKKDITKTLIDAVNSNVKSIQEMAKDSLKESDNLDMKFFEFTSRTSEYMLYVNLLCRMCAIYMEIGEYTVPGTDKKYCEYNWFEWRLSNAFANRAINPQTAPEFYYEGAKNIVVSAAESVYEATGLKSLVDEVSTSLMGNPKETKEEKSEATGYGKIAESMNGINRVSNSLGLLDSYYMDFFVKPPQYSDSFSNSTTESKLANSIQSIADLQKEIAFLFGDLVTTNSKLLDENSETYTRDANALIDNYFENGSAKRMFSRLVTGSAAVITGSNLIFPELWNSSSYDRNFQVEITLSTPYGDRESIFLEIMVPMMHLLAFVLPRQSSVNAYTSPFLVRATLPGYFSCEMGIIKDMSITKGGSSGDCWSIEGLPTEVQISLGIQDLYNALSMGNFSTPKSAWNFAHNSSLIDFIGVQCGLNMRSNEWTKKLSVINSLVQNIVSDKKDFIATSIQEISARSMFKIFAGK